MNNLKCLFLFLFVFFLVGFCGCLDNRLVLVNKYKYFEATIDDIPSVNKIEAAAIMNCYHPEMGQIMLLVGNQKKVEEIIGHEINPQKVVNDRRWIERIVADFKNAKQLHPYKTAKKYGRGDIENAHAVFITKNRAYMIPIRDTNGEFVSGPNYESKELKKDFDELGID